MLKALFGPSSNAHTLRRGLDQEMVRHREIARRVAGALESSTQASGDGAAGSPDAAADLATDMADLADTQLRYEAEARLLQLVYQGLRSSIRNG